MQPTLDKLTFAQHRQLVALLIDRVIVNDTQVEIRYVVPTGPKGETTPCYVNLQEKKKTLPFSGTSHRLLYFPFYIEPSMRTSPQ